MKYIPAKRRHGSRIILGFIFGYIICAVVLAVNEMDKDYWRLIAYILVIIGSMMVLRNTFAHCGYTEKRPSLGGGIAWWFAASLVVNYFDLSPITGSILIVLAVSPFIIHSILTNEEA